jgi:hypothetical protein
MVESNAANSTTAGILQDFARFISIPEGVAVNAVR